MLSVFLFFCVWSTKNTMALGGISTVPPDAADKLDVNRGENRREQEANHKGGRSDERNHQFSREILRNTLRVHSFNTKECYVWLNSLNSAPYFQISRVVIVTKFHIHVEHIVINSMDDFCLSFHEFCVMLIGQHNYTPSIVNIIFSGIVKSSWDFLVALKQKLMSAFTNGYFFKCSYLSFGFLFSFFFVIPEGTNE